MQEWRGLRGSDRECLIGLWGLVGLGDTLADKRFLHFVKCLCRCHRGHDQGEASGEND